MTLFMAPTVVVVLLGIAASSELLESTDAVVSFLDKELRSLDLDEDGSASILNAVSSALNSSELRTAFSQISEQRKTELKKRLQENLSMYRGQESFKTPTARAFLQASLVATIQSVLLTPIESPASEVAVAQLKSLRDSIVDCMKTEFPEIDRNSKWGELSREIDANLLGIQSSDMTKMYKLALPDGEYEDLKSFIQNERNGSANSVLSDEWKAASDTQREKLIKTGRIRQRERQLSERVGNAYYKLLPPDYLQQQAQLQEKFAAESNRLASRLYDEQLEIVKIQRERSINELEEQFAETLKEQIALGQPKEAVIHPEKKAAEPNGRMLWIISINVMFLAIVSVLALWKRRSRIGNG